jgi:hypothetical protein
MMPDMSLHPTAFSESSRPSWIRHTEEKHTDIDNTGVERLLKTVSGEKK